LVVQRRLQRREPLPGGGVVGRRDRGSTAVAATRTGDAGDVDAPRPKRLCDARERTGVVLQIDQERNHRVASSIRVARPRRLATTSRAGRETIHFTPAVAPGLPTPL